MLILSSPWILREWPRFGRRNHLEDTPIPWETASCLVLKFKWKGFKLAIRRNGAPGLVGVAVPSWALGGVLGGWLCCSYSYRDPQTRL